MGFPYFFTRAKTPTAQDSAEYNAFDYRNFQLPTENYIGAATMVQNRILPGPYTKNRPLFSKHTDVVNGLGGLVAGQIIRQPLTVPAAETNG